MLKRIFDKIGYAVDNYTFFNLFDGFYYVFARSFGKAPIKGSTYFLVALSMWFTHYFMFRELYYANIIVAAIPEIIALFAFIFLTGQRGYHIGFPMGLSMLVLLFIYFIYFRYIYNNPEMVYNDFFGTMDAIVGHLMSINLFVATILSFVPSFVERSENEEELLRNDSIFRWRLPFEKE